jgi:hypothetical protein
VEGEGNSRGSEQTETPARRVVEPSNEIRMVLGVVFIPLPKEFDRTFVFSAGLGSSGAPMLILHAKFPCTAFLLLFTMSRLDFAGEFRREG